jgi:tetratricopeptide (TPR) repeat protein
MAVIPDPLVRDALEEVLKIANEAPDAQRISAMSQLACIPPYANDMPRSKQLSARALELARGLGQRGALFESLRSRLYSLSGPDDIDDLLAAAGEILELDRERPTVMSIEAHSARLGALRYRCEAVAADQALDAIDRTARELRLPEAIWYCDRQRAQQRFLHGDFAGASAAYRELGARSARMGLGYGAWFIDTLQTVLTIEQVGLVAYAAGRDFSGLMADAPNLQPNVRARILRGAAELGGKSARPGLEVLAAQGFDTIPKDISYLHALANIALAVVELADLPRAEQLYALLAPYPKHNTPDALLFDQGSVSRYLGLLAASLGRDSEVEAHFEQALATNRAMNRRSQIAHSYYELARWHAGRASPGSAARAKELALEATKAADDLGMHWLAEQARTLSA